VRFEQHRSRYDAPPAGERNPAARSKARAELFPFVADAYMLQLGLKLFVKLDADACVSTPLAVLGSYARSHHVTDAQGWQAPAPFFAAGWTGAASPWRRTSDAVLKKLAAEYAFDPNRHAFDPRLLVVNAEASSPA